MTRAKPAPKEMASRTTRLEWLPLGQLQSAKRNPKQHRSEIGTSIGRFGYVEPIVLDERTGRIVAGHGRREALLAMRMHGEVAPSGIRTEGEEWLVPVLRGGDLVAGALSDDLLSYMHDNPIALCEGLKAMFQDSLSVQDANDWRDRPDRLRKRVAWYRRKESAPRSGEHLWRVGTERWTEREIKSGTSGRYLEARRARVAARTRRRASTTASGSTGWSPTRRATRAARGGTAGHGPLGPLQLGRRAARPAGELEHEGARGARRDSEDPQRPR